MTQPKNDVSSQVLREKLEADPSDPRVVLTIGRAGYQLADESGI